MVLIDIAILTLAISAEFGTAKRMASIVATRSVTGCRRLWAPRNHCASFIFCPAFIHSEELFPKKTGSSIKSLIGKTEYGNGAKGSSRYA